MSARSYFGKEDITPDFLKEQKSVTSARTSAAQNSLKKLEQKSSELNDATRTSAAEAEKSFYTGSGKDSNDSNPKGKKRKGLNLNKGSVKKSAPLMIILGAVFAFIFFLFGSASMLGSQLETLVTRATDTMFGSYSQNAVRVTKEVLDGKRGNFPDYMKDRFEKRNIEVQAQGSGYALIYDGHTITSANFDDYYENDIEFREAFTRAKRGRTSNFFDIGAGLVYGKLMLSRNLFSNFKNTGDTEADTQAYRDTETQIFEGGTNTKLNTVTEEEFIDEDGNTQHRRVPAGSDVNSGTIQGDTPTVKAKGYLMDISKRVSDAGGIACAALKVGNIIATAVAVNEIYQAINYFLGNQENVSKTLAGQGENAAMNPYLNHISETKTTNYIDAETGEEKEVTGSALEAEGFANALAGEKASTNKTKNYSIESAFITTGFAIGLTAVNNRLCGGIRVAGAVISLLSFAVSGGLFSSIVTLAKTVVVNAALQATITSMLSALIPRIAQTMFTNTFEGLEGIPAGERLVEGADLINSKTGREGQGQLLADKKTAAAYNKYTVLAASKEAELDRATHSPFDASNPNTFIGSFVGKFAHIAGSSTAISAVSSIMNITSRAFSSISRGLFGSAYAVSNLSDVELTVDTTLSGTDFQSILADEDTCKNLTEIGAACDMYGAEIIASHPDTIDIPSDDPKYLEVLSRNVTKDEKGHYKVIEGSLLSKKVKYCDGRDSPFGILDANIINDFEVSLGILDSVPVLGDVVDIVSAVESSSDEAIGWGRGTYCVMNEDTNPYVEDLIYLQHFEEDQRVASQMKLDEVTDENGNDVNAITAYKTEYYEKNPIDTSEAGLIAHFTGSTKEDAELTIALLNYTSYLANYVPPRDLPSETLANRDLENIPAQDGYFYYTIEDDYITFTEVARKNIEYSPLRSKSYAA